MYEKASKVKIDEGKTDTGESFEIVPTKLKPKSLSNQKYATIRDFVKQLASEGEPARYWYEQSGQALLDITDGDVEEAKKLLSIIAITSPQMDVKTNFGQMVKGYYKAIRGDEPLAGRFPGEMSTKIQKVMDGEEWAGLKTDKFYKNLVAVIEGGTPDVTVDMWMMRAFGIDKDNPTELEYRKIEALVQKIADDLGWQPYQVQASIWTATKARWDSIYNGMLKKAKNAGVVKSTPKGLEWKSPEAYKNFRKRMFKEMRAVQLSPDQISKSGFDYADAINQYKGRISHEVIPHPSTGVLDGIQNAPYEQQLEYHKAVSDVLTDENGRDIIAKTLEIPEVSTHDAPGFYEGESVPSTQTEILYSQSQAYLRKMPVLKRDIDGNPILDKDGKVIKELDENGKVKKELQLNYVINPETVKSVELYSAIRGLITRQKAVGYTKEFTSPSKKMANAVSIKIDQSLSEAVILELTDRIRKETGVDTGLMATDYGFVTVNFFWDNKGTVAEYDKNGKLVSGIENNDFYSRVKEVVNDVLNDVNSDVELGRFTSLGNLIENDWSIDKNGENYRKRITEGRRSDLASELVNTLSSEIDQVNQSFSDQYGWGQEGQQQEITPETSQVAEESIPISATQQESYRDTKVPDTAPIGEGESFEITPAQKEFFKDTKVVDDKGDPLVVYHGSPSGDFAEFYPFSYFTDSPEVASDFANMDIESTRRIGQNVKPVYVDIKNPKIYRTTEEYEDFVMEGKKSGENLDKLVEQGYDGIIWDDELRGKPHHKTGEPLDIARYYIPFKPEQIKSVFNQNPAETGESFEITPAQEEYFKDTKVVDDKGNPKAVYHGTYGVDEFKVFEKGDIGYHFGTQDQAHDRITVIGGDPESQQRIIPVYLNIKNPLRMRDVGKWDNAYGVHQELLTKNKDDIDTAKLPNPQYTGYETRFEVLRKYLEDQGYDGIIYENQHEGLRSENKVKREFEVSHHTVDELGKGLFKDIFDGDNNMDNFFGEEIDLYDENWMLLETDGKTYLGGKDIDEGTWRVYSVITNDFGNTYPETVVGGGKTFNEAIADITRKNPDSYIAFRPEQIRSVFNQNPAETGESFEIVSDKDAPKPKTKKDKRPSIKSAFEKLKDDWFGEKDWEAQLASIEASDFQDEIQSTVEKLPRLKDISRSKFENDWQNVDKAILIYLDLKRNPTHYKKYYKDLTPEQKKIVDLAKNLTKEQKAIAKKIALEFEKVGKKSLEAGQINNILDNYVNRVWDIENKSSDDFFSKFGTKTRHAKQRVFETILEGMANGFNLKVGGASNSLNILKVEIANAIENQKLIKAGMEIVDPDGNKLFTIRDKPGYRRIDNPRFSTWKVSGKATPEEAETWSNNFFVTEDGNIMERVPIYAPAEVANDLNKILGTSVLNKVPGISEITKFGAHAKAWILQSSLFHHQAFMRSYLFGGAIFQKGAPKNPLTAYKKGLAEIKKRSPEIELLVRNGLTLGRMQDWDETVLQQQTIVGEILDKNKVTKAIKDKVLLFQERQARGLFNKFGAGLKAQAGLLEYQHLLKKYPDMSPDERAKIVANLINEDFGGLHLQRMGRNPSVQHIARLALLAPDWTESNVRTMVKAIKAGSKEETEVYRHFWGRVITRAMGATALANFLVSALDREDDEDTLEALQRRYIEAWEAGHLRWLDVDITPVYKALDIKADKEGHKKKGYFSIVGHFRDPVKFILNPSRSVKHKQSVPVRIFEEFFSGTNWQGRAFTSYDELLGLDDMELPGGRPKDVYKTTKYLPDGSMVKAGDSKGGKLGGQLVKWGKGEAINLNTLPSYTISQLKNIQPVQVQNAISYLSGEMDGFTALMKSLGMYVSAEEKPE